MWLQCSLTWPGSYGSSAHSLGQAVVAPVPTHLARQLWLQCPLTWPGSCDSSAHFTWPGKCGSSAHSLGQAVVAPVPTHLACHHRPQSQHALSSSTSSGQIIFPGVSNSVALTATWPNRFKDFMETAHTLGFRHN